MKTMKAVRIHEYGPANVLKYEDAPQPVPNPDDLLIEVHATSVNPVDCGIRAGYMAGWFKHSFPLTLGWDVSGVVVGIGDEANGFSLGDEVYGRGDLNRNGAYAEYIAIRASEVTLKPKSLDHNHAASVPHVGLTAWNALFDTADLREGQTVLIHGAAGGVGSMGVQLAKWKGAHVIGTASHGNHSHLRRLGVDEAIDYTTTAFESAVKNVDVVFDTIGGDTQQRSWGIIKPGGILVSVVQYPPPEMAAQYGVRGAMAVANINATALAQMAHLVDSGVIKTTVSSVLPFMHAQHAHEMSESRRTRGKIVLRVADH